MCILKKVGHLFTLNVEVNYAVAREVFSDIFSKRRCCSVYFRAFHISFMISRPLTTEFGDCPHCVVLIMNELASNLPPTLAVYMVS